VDSPCFSFSAATSAQKPGSRSMMRFTDTACHFPLQELGLPTAFKMPAMCEGFRPCAASMNKNGRKASSRARTVGFT
jgi:hypothetical protein